MCLNGSMGKCIRKRQVSGYMFLLAEFELVLLLLGSFFVDHFCEIQTDLTLNQPTKSTRQKQRAPALKLTCYLTKSVPVR